MKIVFWLDPKVGFDWSTPEVVSNIADGLAEMGYDVELLVEDQMLDDFVVEQAVRRVWFEESQQQILTDVLVSNRLDHLTRNDLSQAGKRIWLALEEDVASAVEYFETYQLHDEIGIITLHRTVKDRLAQANISSLLLRPGIRLDRCKLKTVRERESQIITIGLFDERPEVVRAVLQGVEMTRLALNRLEVQLFVHQDLEVTPSLPIQVKVRPSLEERVRCYQNSEIFIYIPGPEKFSTIPLEAMAVGVPVILSQHPAAQEYVKNRQNCILMGKMHPKGLALAVLNIVKIGNIREQLRSQGFKTSQEYDLKPGLRSLEQLWSTPYVVRDISPTDPDPGGGTETLDLVMINHNSGEGLTECLTSLRQHTTYPHRILVVDNGSSDESLECVKEEPGISLIRNQQDNGFAKACNQGILAGKGDYILLFNSHYRFTEGWAEPLLAEINKPNVGMVYPQVAHRHCEAEDEEETGAEVKSVTPFPCNSMFLIRRDLLNKLGLLDEELFLFFEDLDYSLRAEEKGYQVVHCPGSNVTYICEDPRLSEQEEVRSQWNRLLAQSRRRLKEKWGDLSPEYKPRRLADGIVFLSLHPWQERAQRTQAWIDFLIQQGQKVVYVEPYCSNRPAEMLENGRYLYTCKGNGTIHFNLINPGRRVELSHELKAQLSRWGIQIPILMVEAPWWEPMVKHLEHRMLVYTGPELLLRDELETLQQLREKFTPVEKTVIQAADLVIVASRKRKDEVAGDSDRVLYNPGGFVPHSLDRFLKGHYTMPEEISLFAGPKVGLVGTFNRFFPKFLLKEIVHRHPDVQFLFIGEITCDLGELGQIPNLHFLSNRGWDHLLDCLYFFDLILYPYPARGLNLYIDPYMVNYYLAMGKPVIAFDHPELEQYGWAIQRAANDQEFLEFVAQTLQRLEGEKGEERIRERLAQVRGHTWEIRLEELYAQLADVLPLPAVLEIPAAAPVTEQPLVIAEEGEKAFTSIWKQIIGRFWGRKGTKR